MNGRARRCVALAACGLASFHGPAGTEMSARGGNPALDDEQVNAAVDYMAALVATLSGEKQ